MDIRNFFGAGGRKKEDVKKKEHISKKPSEVPFEKSSKSQSERNKSGEKEKKSDKKVLQEMSEEEVDFKKVKRRSRSGGKMSEMKKEKEHNFGKEPSTAKSKEEVKKKPLAMKSSRLPDEEEEEEEDEDVMNVKKKYKPAILNSESEEEKEEEEDPFPKSMRKKRQKEAATNNNSITRAFTQMVPKQTTDTKTSVKKAPRHLVNAIDFFGTEPIKKTSGEEMRRGMEEVEGGALKEEKVDRVKKERKKEEEEEERGEDRKKKKEEKEKENKKKKEDKKKKEEEEDVVMETPVKTLAEKLALKKSKGLKEEYKEGMKKDGGMKEDKGRVNKDEGKKGEKGVKEDKGKKVEKEGTKSDKKKKEDEEEKKKEKRKRKKDDIGKDSEYKAGGDEEEEEEEEEEEMKKKKKKSYMEFKQREPPKALGSRQLPEGAENCMEGMTLVLTGVYESVERDDVKSLLERLGARVTTTVSRRTSYLVVGREPGPSKVTKAKELGTQVLDEGGLFDLIPTLPPKVSKYQLQAEQEAAKTPKSSKRSQQSATPSSPSSPSPSSPSPSSSKKKDTTINSTKKTSASSGDVTKTSSSDRVGSARGVEDSLLWTDKYKPESLKQLVGQQGPKSQAHKLMAWLRNWKHNSQLKPIFGRPNEEGVGLKAALLSGPPGVGKTTTAQVVCRELSFSYVELNASDTRSKKSLREEVVECLNNQSLVTLFGAPGGEVKRHCLLMDEVDGMSGNEDRGGVQELIQLIKHTHIPIICLCNDRNHPKIRSLAGYCFDLRFQRPRAEQLKSAIMSIAYKEGVKIPPSSLNDVIAATNHDLRQILLNLSMWTVRQRSPTHDDLKKQADDAKKDLHYSPFDVCRRVFSNDHERHRMTLRDKSDLFFHDYNIAPLFVQENYLSVTPTRARGEVKRHLALLSGAADSMCQGDLVDSRVRRLQAWSLLPLQALYCSVLPGEYLCGGVGGMVQFPAWLGKNSSRTKSERLLQELNLHTRVAIKGDKGGLNLDYLPAFKHLITTPLLHSQLDPVVDLMTSYHLLRDDLESVRELTSWSKGADLFGRVDSKVKAGLTRQLNKHPHLTPYSSASVKKGGRSKAKGVASLDGEEEEDDDGADDDDAGADDDDPDLDAMIVKKKKASGSKQATNKTAPKKQPKTSAPKKKK